MRFEEIPSQHPTPEDFKLDEKEMAKMRDLFDRSKERKTLKVHSSKLIDFHAVSALTSVVRR